MFVSNSKEPMDDPWENQAVPPRSLSAGLLSFGVHLILVIGLALSIRPGTSLPIAEADRPVEIVLARPNMPVANRYVDESASAASAPAEAAKGNSNAVADSAAELTQQLVARELALPESKAISAANLLPDAPLATPGGGLSFSIPMTGDVSKFVADEQARLAAGRPIGSPTSVGLFGGEAAVGRSFVFLIDRSKSMGSGGLNALQAAEDELARALAKLQPVHKFQLIAYHHQCVYLGRRELLAATDDNKNSVRGFLGGLAAFGATEHEMALVSALQHRPDVIFLLTDGGDPELTDPQLRKITKLAAGKTTIHCVQFGFGPLGDSESNFMRRLATMTGGGFRYVDMSPSK